MDNTVIVTLLEVLKARERSLYSLMQATGVSYSALHNLAKGKTASIDFRMLALICTELECLPGDLLKVVPAKKGKKSKP